jgi:hypothetical protein
VKERSVEYFRERERAEREAAKNATCDAARWAHQEMADSYARMLQNVEPAPQQIIEPKLEQ